MGGGLWGVGRACRWLRWTFGVEPPFCSYSGGLITALHVAATEAQREEDAKEMGSAAGGALEQLLCVLAPQYCRNRPYFDSDAAICRTSPPLVNRGGPRSASFPLETPPAPRCWHDMPRTWLTSEALHVAIGGALLSSNFGDMFHLDQSPCDPAFFVAIRAKMDRVWHERQ